MKQTVLGILVLVVGVIILGAWGRSHHARTIEEKIATTAQQKLGQTTHDVSLAIQGRDITVSGLADSEEERENILAQLDDVDGRRIVVDNLKVLPTANPYLFKGQKSDTGLTYSGHKPMVDSFKTELGQGAENLDHASGMPNDQWPQAVGSSVKGLKKLQVGTLEISNTAIKLQGMADSSKTKKEVEALLADLPQGYTAETNITLPPSPSGLERTDDDVAVALDYDVTTGVVINGVVPSGMEMETITEALNTSITGIFKQSTKSDDGKILSQLQKLKSWLPVMESAKVALSPAKTSVEGIVLPGSNLDFSNKGISEDLGADSHVNLAQSTQQHNEGDERVNSLTQNKESFQSGYWLPVFDFEASREVCELRVNKTLESTKINFLSGSANLDPKSTQTINSLSSIMAHCLKPQGLTIEIGGHTDSQGSDSANLALSTKRAEAVRKAFMARGVPENKLTAQGYGETQPIADNNTKEGRAQNRRTTFTWSEQ